MKKFEEYLYLLSKSYQEVVNILLQKYGDVTDDYYREVSYQRFLRNEIKSITKGKFSGTNRGLYCHHIGENIHLNLSDLYYIKKHKYPFKYQKRENLVYCDLIEHSILHVLIGQEDKKSKYKNRLGIPGFETYLSNEIEEWYILGSKPKLPWKLNCYEKAFITPSEAFLLLKKMHEKLDIYYEQTFEECNSRIQSKHKYLLFMKKREKERKEAKPVVISHARKIDHNSPLEEIIKTMYELAQIGSNAYFHLSHQFAYSKEFDRSVILAVDYKIFEKSMTEYPTKYILGSIQSYLDYEDGLINRSEYFDKLESYSVTKKEIKEIEEKERIRLQYIKNQKNEFYAKYPKFEEKDIKYDENRQTISFKLFKFQKDHKSFIKFQSILKDKSLEELLAELHSLL